MNNLEPDNIIVDYILEKVLKRLVERAGLTRGEEVKGENSLGS